MSGSVPVLFGAAYSVYVRICRLALAEKGVAYRLEEVDVHGPGGVPASHLARHPFGKIPAFAHDGFALYESGAISRYVDEAFAGPALQPPAETPQARARMNQAISILDAYAYPHWVWGLFVERVRKPVRGQQPDEARVSTSRAAGETCADALAAILGPAPWLGGTAPGLADLHAAPMLACLAMTAEGRAMLAARPPLAAWWERLRLRPSMVATKTITDD